MNPIVYDLRLDAVLGGSQATVVVKRGDRFTRLLRARLYAGSTPAVLRPGTLAVLRGLREDGAVLYNDCTVEGNEIEQVLTSQMMAVSGLMECELTVYGPGGEVLTSPRFEMIIEEALYEDGQIESTDEFTALTGGMTRLAALEQTVEDNEAERVELYDEIRETFESGGFTGADGPMGPAGPQGPQGVKGDIGPQGLRGESGPEGPTGPQGPQGPKGDKGDTGLQGPQGAQGPKGDKGDTGIQGPKGDKGDTGAQGPAGVDGTSFAVLGRYDTLAQLQAAHPTGMPGQAYAVGSIADNTIYVWSADTSAWTSVGKLQGPEGPQGLKGDKGDKGDTGDTGAQGNTGPQGETGLQGPKGDKGDKGDTGDTGAQGLKGDKGDPGAHFTPSVNASGDISWTNNGGLANPATVNIKGPQGLQGLKGDTGDTGAQGAKGDKGDAGAGVPTGGAAGQVLKKSAAADYATAWGALAAADVGAVPTSRTVNSKALSANISLTATDVGAAIPAKSVVLTLLASGWSGNTQSLTNANILAASPGSLRIAQAATPEQYAAFGTAQPQVVAQAAGSIMVRANGEVPTINIPLELEVRS